MQTGTKKMSVCSRTEKNESGLSNATSVAAPDTYAAKMKREEASRMASRRQGLKSRAEEQRFAVDQSLKLIKKDKF